jgi:hypothetical protein
MPDPIKKKKVNTTPNQSAVSPKMVQYPASDGNASTYVRADSPKGKRIEQAKKLLALKKQGKKLLNSEESLIKKTLNPRNMGNDNKPTPKIQRKK